MCILCLGFLLAVIAYLLRFLYQKYRKISFAGKTILITGASSGIGEEYALQLSQYKDTTLILVSNELDKLQEVKAKCAYPENVHIYYIDLSNIKDTQETCQIIGGKLNKLDLLINNAGISFRDIFENTSAEAITRFMNINFTSNTIVTKMFLPFLKKSKEGRILITSSITAYFSNPARTLYVASKAAINSFYNSLRAEIRKYGISVTIICPYYVCTALSSRALTGDGKQFGKMDKQIMKGYQPSYVVRKSLRSCYLKENELWICPICRIFLIKFLMLFPDVMACYANSRLAEQLETIKKD